MMLTCLYSPLLAQKFYASIRIHELRNFLDGAINRDFSLIHHRVLGVVF